MSSMGGGGVGRWEVRTNSVCVTVSLMDAIVHKWPFFLVLVIFGELVILCSFLFLWDFGTCVWETNSLWIAVVIRIAMKDVHYILDNTVSEGLYYSVPVKVIGPHVNRETRSSIFKFRKLRNVLKNQILLEIF